MSYRLGSSDNDRRRARLRKPVAVETVLTAALRRYGLERGVQRYRFVLKWKEIVGVEVARRTRPESFRGGVLTVRVANSVWAQELSFRKALIMRRMSEFLPSGEAVTDIHFFVDGTLEQAA